MATLYSSRQKVRKRRHVIIALILVILALGVVGLGWLVYTDLRKADIEIDTSKNIPITNRITSADGINQIVSEATFEFKIPENWEEYERTNDSTQNVIKFKSSDKNKPGQKLEVYVDKIPNNVSFTKDVAVKVSENKLKPSVISPQCYTFSEATKENPDYIESKWEETKFMCYMHKNQNIVGITDEEPELGVKVINHRYLFIYTDNNAQVNNNLFLDMLKTFKAK